MSFARRDGGGAIFDHVRSGTFRFFILPDALVCANPLSAEFSNQGPAPRLWLVGWDSEPKRRIATETVAHLDHRRSRYASEYADLAGYCNSGETDALLYAVTRSAEINQELLPKPCFSWACKVAKQFDAALLSRPQRNVHGFRNSARPGRHGPACRTARNAACEAVLILLFSKPEVWRATRRRRRRKPSGGSSRIDNPALSDSLTASFLTAR